MTDQTKQILDGLAASVETNRLNLAATTKTYNDLLTQVVELRRQADYHRSKGDETNLQIVNNQLAPLQTQMDAAKVNMDNSKLSYDASVTAYSDAQKKLLSPEELKVELVKAQSEADLQAALVSGKVIAQKTTQYLIWGAVGLVIVVIAIIIYKKKFAGK